MKNHYNVLELDKNCTAKEIKDSYIKLSKKYHPDRNKSKDAQKKIIEINEAYSVLKNRATRLQYDERLRGNDMQRQAYENARQNSRGYNYNRAYTYEDYIHYQRSHYQMNNQGYAEPSFSTRKLSAVICCCMLMMFGAGLRIMYARSDSIRRKKLNEMAAKNVASTQAEKPEKPELERYRLILKNRHERESRKKSDS